MSKSMRKVLLLVLLLGALAGVHFGLGREASEAPVPQAHEARLPEADAAHRSTAQADSRPPSSAASTERGPATPEQTETGLSLAAVLDLSAQGWDEEILSARARFDPEFAEKLRQLAILCSDISNGSQRFDDPRWATYRHQCGAVSWPSLQKRSIDEGWPIQPGVHPDIETALDLSPGDPAAATLAAGVLASSTERMHLMGAVMLYYDRNQIRAMADPDLIRGVNYSDISDMAFRIEAAQYVACRFSSQRCDWNSAPVLLECAATAGCFPGMTMHQIFALRNSPLQMELLERVAEDVAQMRR